MNAVQQQTVHKVSSWKTACHTRLASSKVPMGFDPERSEKYSTMPPAFARS